MNPQYLEYSSIKSFYVCQKSTFSENDLLFKRPFKGRPAGNGKIANDSNSTDPAAPDSRSARTNRLVVDYSPWITRAALHLPHHPTSRGATRLTISDFLRGCGPSFPRGNNRIQLVWRGKQRLVPGAKATRLAAARRSAAMSG
jgi:hypothetical protein